MFGGFKNRGQAERRSFLKGADSSLNCDKEAQTFSISPKLVTQKLSSFFQQEH